MCRDGGSRPSVDKKTTARRPDGTSVQKYVLVAFDFARAYAVVDHRLLQVSLIERASRCASPVGSDSG